MNSTTDLRRQAQDALERVWFVQSVEETERTDRTLSLRLHIRSGLFVQVFFGEASESLYLALIQDRRRIFGIDRVMSEWHLHPYDAPDTHEPLAEGLEPQPLLKFLARVEDLLLQYVLL
ncbi:MAG TPA: hypothetical protein VF429_02360 [Anaerolineae bacterium]|jgi:hypothetical protein